jgi:hypothetical protein
MEAIKSSDAHEWFGFIENDLNCSEEPEEVRLPRGSLLRNELNVISWYPRVDVPSKWIPQEAVGNVEGSATVTVLGKSGEQWKVTFRGSDPFLLPKEAISLSIEPPMDNSDSMYFSIDSYMRVTSDHLHKTERPQQRPSFIVDLSFDHFCAVWSKNISAERGADAKDLPSGDSLLIADYELSMLFVKCFLSTSCNDATTLPTTPNPAAFLTSGSGGWRDTSAPQILHREKSERIELFWNLLIALVHDHIDWSAESSSKKGIRSIIERGGKTHSVLLFRLMCYVAESQIEKEKNQDMKAWSIRAYRSELWKQIQRQEIPTPGKGSHPPVPDSVKAYLVEKIASISQLANMAVLGTGSSQAQVQSFGSDKFLTTSCFWTHSEDTILSLLQRRGPDPPTPAGDGKYPWGVLNGPMKMVRVSSNDGATEMSARLRRLSQKLHWARCFDIVEDTADSGSSAGLRPQFLLNMQSRKCSADGCKCEKFDWKDVEPNSDKEVNASTILCASCNHLHSKCDTYDHWRCPILLILNQKGKIGETFPCDEYDLGLGLDCVDMRIKAAPSFLAPAIQELGRLCRYTKSTSKKLPYCVVSTEFFKNFVVPATKPGVKDCKQALPLEVDEWCESVRCVCRGVVPNRSVSQDRIWRNET